MATEKQKKKETKKCINDHLQEIALERMKLSIWLSSTRNQDKVRPQSLAWSVQTAKNNSCFTCRAGRPLGGQLNGVWQTKWCKPGTGTGLVKGTAGIKPAKCQRGSFVLAQAVIREGTGHQWHRCDPTANVSKVALRCKWVAKEK